MVMMEKNILEYPADCLNNSLNILYCVRNSQEIIIERHIHLSYIYHLYHIPPKHQHFLVLSIECSSYFTIVYSIIQAIQHLLHHVLLGGTDIRLVFVFVSSHVMLFNNSVMMPEDNNTILVMYMMSNGSNVVCIVQITLLLVIKSLFLL